MTVEFRCCCICVEKVTKVTSCITACISFPRACSSVRVGLETRIENFASPRVLRENLFVPFHRRWESPQSLRRLSSVRVNSRYALSANVPWDDRDESMTVHDNASFQRTNENASAIFGIRWIRDESTRGGQRYTERDGQTAEDLRRMYRDAVEWSNRSRWIQQRLDDVRRIARISRIARSRPNRWSIRDERWCTKGTTAQFLFRSIPRGAPYRDSKRESIERSEFSLRFGVCSKSHVVDAPILHRSMQIPALGFVPRTKDYPRFGWSKRVLALLRRAYLENRFTWRTSAH